MSFGHALYYPYIHLTNKNWLKHSFLFWDKLSRIVPSSFEPQDSEDIIKIRQETNFLEDYHPDSWVISKTFKDFTYSLEHQIKKEYATKTLVRNPYHSIMPKPSKYKELFKDSLYETKKNGSYIHIEKIDSDLIEKLYQLGLAIPGENSWSNWIKIDNKIGTLYMTYLAKSISNEKSIPIVTDTEDFYISQKLPFNEGYHQKFEEKLGCLLIDVVLPKNINNVTMEQLINIKNKYDDQRINFFNKINELSSTLPTIDNKSSLEDALNHHVKSLANDTKELKKIYESNGIDAMIKPLSISMPTAIASLSDIVPVEYKPLGVGAGLLYGVVSYFNELDKRHRESQKNPMSYLLSIQTELNKKSLFRRIEHKLSGRYK